MSDVIKVNKLELASELAHRMLVIEWDDRSESIYEDDTVGVTVYSENAQDIFDDYYDMFLTIIEDTHVMTNKESIISHVERISWFNHDETNGNTLTFSTRENGNVGDEEPGEKDIQMAHRVAGDIRHQYDVKNIEVSSVDEWVYLEFEIV